MSEGTQETKHLGERLWIYIDSEWTIRHCTCVKPSDWNVKIHDVRTPFFMSTNTGSSYPLRLISWNTMYPPYSPTSKTPPLTPLCLLAMADIRHRQTSS